MAQTLDVQSFFPHERHGGCLSGFALPGHLHSCIGHLQGCDWQIGFGSLRRPPPPTSVAVAAAAAAAVRRPAAVALHHSLLGRPPPALLLLLHAHRPVGGHLRTRQRAAGVVGKKRAARLLPCHAVPPRLLYPLSQLGHRALHPAPSFLLKNACPFLHYHHLTWSSAAAPPHNRSTPPPPHAPHPHPLVVVVVVEQLVPRRHISVGHDGHAVVAVNHQDPAGIEGGEDTPVRGVGRQGERKEERIRPWAWVEETGGPGRVCVGGSGSSEARSTGAQAAARGGVRARARRSLCAAVGGGGVVGKAQRVALLPRIDHPLQAAGGAGAGWR